MAIDQTTNTNAKKSCFNLVVMIGVHFTSLLKKKKKNDMVFLFLYSVSTYISDACLLNYICSLDIVLKNCSILV